MKKLIIAPHVDDEAIGCGGILDSNTFVYFCGVDRFHEISQEERLVEVKNVSEFFDYTCEVNLDSIVNQYDQRQFIDIFQEVINEHKPDRMYIPYPSYNQDHREIYDAVMIALRPHDRNFFVKQVVVYEGMDSFQWGHSAYEVNHFAEIDIDRKLEGYRKHVSQVRGHRGCDHLRALAKLRGSQMGAEYAEGFIVKRWVD